MSVNTEARRVVTIARRLGVERALVVGQNGARRRIHEGFVELWHGARTAVVRVADYERDGADVERAWRGRDEDVGNLLIADVDVAAGAGTMAPPGLSAVHAIAGWVGVGAHVAHEVHDGMLVRSMRSRKGGATRRARVGALDDAFLERVVSEALERPDQVDYVIARAARGMPSGHVDINLLYTTIAALVIERVGLSEAAAHCFPGPFGQRVITRGRDDIVERVAAMLQDRHFAESDEDVRRSMWSMLKPFPLSVRTKQAELLKDAEVIAGVERAMHIVPGVRAQRVLYLASCAGSRAALSTLLVIDWELGMRKLPWTVVSHRQAAHVDQWADGLPPLDPMWIEPYATDGELRDEIGAFLQGDASGLSVPVENIVIGESGGTGLSGASRAMLGEVSESPPSWRDLVRGVAGRVIGEHVTMDVALNDLGGWYGGRNEMGDAIAAEIVQRMGLLAALQHGFAAEVASFIERHAIQAVAETLRDRIDAGEMGENIEDIRRATWDMLRPYPLAVRCAQAEVLDLAGVGWHRLYTDGMEFAPRGIAQMRVADRVQLMALVLYRPQVPADVPAWVWFSDCQKWMLSPDNRSWRPPDAALDPYPDAASMRADLEAAARSGRVFVPLEMPPGVVD